MHLPEYRFFWRQRPNNSNTHGSWPFNTRYPDRIIFKYTMDYHSIMICNFISSFSYKAFEIYFMVV